MSDHESPEEIERDIERTRADIDRTLNDLQYRLSPNTLINKALGSARVKTTLQSAGSDGRHGRQSGRTMSSNPIPVLAHRDRADVAGVLQFVGQWQAEATPDRLRFRRPGDASI